MICKVCKKFFIPRKENKYLAQEPRGLSDLVSAPTTYEAFDCPRCGCQNLVNIREPEVNFNEFISTSN